MERGSFEGETGKPLWSVGTLHGHLCKHGWTSWGAVWVVGSHKASCYMWVQIPPHLKDQFCWIGVPIVNYRLFLPLAVQKRLNRSICRLGCGLEWAEGCTNSIVFTRWRQCALMGGHVAITCQITLNHLSTEAMRLMSNYFDHLSSLDMPT